MKEKGSLRKRDLKEVGKKDWKRTSKQRKKMKKNNNCDCCGMKLDGFYYYEKPNKNYKICILCYKSLEKR